MNLLFEAAHPGYTIFGLCEPRMLWHRDVSQKRGKPDPRRGPWHSAVYEKHPIKAKDHNKDCLYVVKASDGGFRYVGFSNKGLSQRWRTPPAVSAATGDRVARPVFHSQCWRHLEKELLHGYAITYQVRVIYEGELSELLVNTAMVSSALARSVPRLKIAAAAERWFRTYREGSPAGIRDFLPWNLE